MLLLPMWWILFSGLRKAELIGFVVINLLFIVSDIGAIQNGFFKFTAPDFAGLPVWEFFMWGFYLMHTHRMFPSKVAKSLDFKLLFLAIIFSQLFAIIPNREILLASTSAVLAITLFFYSQQDDILYCAYLMLLGVATEYVGIKFNLWSYPEKDFNSALVQFVIMWGATGIYFRHIMGGWLIKRTASSTVYNDVHELLVGSMQSRFENACEFVTQKNTAKAAEVFMQIETRARQESVPLNYDFYIQYSKLCIADGNLRKAVELSRDALGYATSNLERAFIYLQLCRIYRMMILMKNARSELNRAFAELKLSPPRDSILISIKEVMIFILQKLRPVQNADEKSKQALQIQVALYEEAGLLGYYFLERPTLLQCILRARRPALQLGDSIQLVNWYGGSSCAWAILGWNKQAIRLIQHSFEVAQKISTSYATDKVRLWKALLLSYQNLSKESALDFDSILHDEKIDLTPYDFRLVMTTLSCNYLLRGHMQKSESCIREITEKEFPRCRYFSQGKAFVDWYRLPALGFLGEHKEAETVLKNAQAVFSRVDEEKWQISQFLGGLLAYYYSLPEKNLQDIQYCLERFSALQIASKLTYLEASQIWVAKAYLYIDLAQQGKLPVKQAVQAVQELSSLQKYSVVKSHWLMAKAKCLLLENKSNSKNADQLCQKALEMALADDNIWVQYEVLRYELMKNANTESTELIRVNLREFCKKNNWKGVMS